MEKYIQKISKKLKDLDIYDTEEETKLLVLNTANDVLYPLKEQKQIQDYHFSASVVGELFELSIFITENGFVTPNRWDLTVVPNKNG
jgi:hypothetical protein